MRDILGRDRRADALTVALLAGLALGAGAGCDGGGGGRVDAGDDGAGADTEPEVGDDFDAAPDWAPPVCAAASGEIQNAACNDQVAGGPCVDEIQVDDNAPGPEGGAVVAGTYDLVERTGYTSPGGATGPLGQPTQETLVLTAAGAGFTLDRAVIAAGAVTRESGAVSVADAQQRMLVSPTCPAATTTDGGAPASIAYYYTAADPQLTLYRIGASGPVQASTYTRR